MSAKCVSCGARLPDSSSQFCKSCDQRLQEYYRSNDRIATFNAFYLGGLRECPRAATRRRVLQLAPGWGVGYQTEPGDGPVRKWDQITSVGVEGGEIAKRKTGAVLAFGVFGALAANGAKDRSFITVVTTEGSEGVWQIDGVQPMEVRAALSPVLQEAGVPFTDSSSSAPTPTAMSVADELEKLANLCERGFLTRDEFEIQKRVLLAGSAD